MGRRSATGTPSTDGRWMSVARATPSRASTMTFRSVTYSVYWAVAGAETSDSAAHAAPTVSLFNVTLPAFGSDTP